MSDTPQLLALMQKTKKMRAYDCVKEFESLARKLEKENAELRKKFMFAESEIILLREDREELRELAARMAKEMRETDHEFCSLVDYDNLQNKI